VGETGQAAFEDAAHDAAGDHDVRIGEPVAHLPAVTLGLHDAGRPQHGEVLRHVGLAQAQGGGEAVDLARPGRELVEDLETARMGQRPEDLGLERRDRVHAPTMRRMRICASVPRVTEWRAGRPAEGRDSR
jgi:hypothetical protein